MVKYSYGFVLCCTVLYFLEQNKTSILPQGRLQCLVKLTTNCSAATTYLCSKDRSLLSTMVINRNGIRCHQSSVLFNCCSSSQFTEWWL